MSTTTQNPAERPEVVALIPAILAEVRAERLNAIEKHDRASRTLGSIVTFFTDRVGFYREAGESDAQYEARRQAHNARQWALREVLTHVAPESENGPEEIARYVASVRRELPCLEELGRALQMVKEIETENLDLEKPSRTQEILAERYRAMKEELSDELSYALTDAQMATLRRCSYHGSVFRPYFRLLRTRSHRDRWTILSVLLRPGPYGARWPLEEYLKYAKTQRDVRELLGCWHVDYRTERRDGATFFILEGYEIAPSR